MTATCLAALFVHQIRLLFPEDKDLDLDELDDRGGGALAQAGAGTASSAVRRFSITNGATTAVVNAAAAATAYAEAAEAATAAAAEEEDLEQIAEAAAARMGLTVDSSS